MNISRLATPTPILSHLNTLVQLVTLCADRLGRPIGLELDLDGSPQQWTWIDDDDDTLKCAVILRCGVPFVEVTLEYEDARLLEIIGWCAVHCVGCVINNGDGRRYDVISHLEQDVDTAMVG